MTSYTTFVDERCDLVNVKLEKVHELFQVRRIYAKGGVLI